MSEASRQLAVTMAEEAATKLENLASELRAGHSYVTGTEMQQSVEHRAMEVHTTRIMRADGFIVNLVENKWNGR